MQRTKKLPDIKKLYVSNTSKPRQTWRQQLAVMSEWAMKHNKLEEMRRKLTDGR